jgi:hypothetical protein
MVKKGAAMRNVRSFAAKLTIPIGAPALAIGLAACGGGNGGGNNPGMNPPAASMAFAVANHVSNGPIQVVRSLLALSSDTSALPLPAI